MRLLHQRLDHDRGGLPQAHQEPERGADQGRALGSQVSLRHPHVDPARGQARGQGDGVKEATMNAIANLSVSRRALLQSTGALIVMAGVPAGTAALAQGAAAAAGKKPPLLPTELDSWIAVGRDGKVTAFF